MSDASDALAARRAEVAAELADLEARLAELRALRERQHDDDEHDPDGVSLSSEWSRLEGLHRDTEAALAGIDEAVARREQGLGGTCEACGRPIAPERLEARPEATRCIDCAA